MSVRDDAIVLLDFSRELRAREAREAERRRLTADKRKLAAAQRRARRPAIALPDALPDGAVERLADRQERALQRRLALDRRFTFWPLLGEIPECGPGEQDVAAVFARKIERVLDHPWSHDERSYLVKLLKKWALRASGKDPRFNVAGNRRGALDTESRRRMAIAKTARD